MVLLPFLLLILACLSGSFGYEDLQKKVFIFPNNKKSGVQVKVPLPDPLTSFTICLRFNPLQFRSFILFAYCSLANCKEIQIIKFNPSQFNLQIGGMTQIIALPNGCHSEWQHICVAWDSTTGLVYFWLNGKLLPRFVMRKGHKISQNGTIVLGHDRESWGKRECFSGEMADVYMWLRVLKPDEVHRVKKNDRVLNPAVDWRALNYTARGNVLVEEALHQVF